MEEDKEFFDSMNPKLTNFYNLEIVETESVKEDLYPIQEELKTLRVKFEGSKKVGAGGMKEIFEVKDLPSGRKVAKAKLKDSSNLKDVESFLREARLTASLQHPNIIRIYDIGFDQHPWFSMELIEGQSLEEKINHHQKTGEEWPLFQRLEIFNKICDALAYAHSKKILHLDIKPDNIRLGLYGEVIVCDWGLGHVLHSQEADVSYETIELDNENTLHGYIRGTPGYMAPERIDNLKTIQTDIFSLGALLFALLNYKAPFNGKDNADVLRNTLSGNICAEKEGIPIGIKSVYQKALKVDERERYSSVQELQNDVEKFRNGFATDAEAASFLKQFILLCKRNKLVCSLAAGFLIIISLVANSYIKDIKERNRQILAEKNKAERALELFKEEQKEKQDIAKNFSLLLVKSAKANTHGFDVEQSIKKLEYALKKDPNNSEAWLVKGYTHFICHQFKDAYFCFEKSGLEQTQKAMEISLKYKDHQGMLSAEENVKLLKEFGDTSDLALTFIFLYDGETRSSYDHSLIVKYIVEYRNKADNFKFYFDEKNHHLDLSNNVGLFDLVCDFEAELKSVSLLKFLKLKSLDLTNTNFSNLNQLRGLELEELTLANTPVMDLRPLLDMKSLKKVILNKEQAKIANGNWTFEIAYTQDQGNKNYIEQAVKNLLTNYKYVDQDKNGSISLKELQTSIRNIPKDILEFFFIKCDINKDQALTLNEINKISSSNLKHSIFIEKVKFEVNRKFRAIDTNGDKFLSLEEVNNYRKIRVSSRIFKLLDLNKDSRISKEEANSK